MAKVKDFKFEINGTAFCIHINVNSSGDFTANIPHFVADSLKIDGKLRFTDLVSLEKELTAALSRYKKASTSQELYIGIYYGHAGHFAQRKNGDYIYGDKYGVSLSWSGSRNSILVFEHDVYIKETVDSVVNWFPAKKGSTFPSWSTEQLSNPDKYYKDGGSLWSNKLDKLKFIPYSEAAMESLDNAREKIRAASEMLYDFIEQDEEAIVLTLTNQKLLN